jgi:tetratricopeptide (TPR) repeat protein
MRNLIFPLFLFACSHLFSQKCTECQALYDNKQYSEVIQKVAENVSAADYQDLVLLAKSYQNLDMKKDAVGAYSHILLNDENNVDALVAVGALFIDMEKFDNALFSTEKALTIEPKNENALHNKAVIYFSQNESDKLNAFLDDQLKINPKNLDFLNIKAINYLKHESYKDAIYLFEKIEAIDSKFPQMNFYYGYALYKNENLGLAKEKFINSIKIDEESAVDTYYYLAHLYIKQEKKIEACDAYTKAINLGDITLTKEADNYCEAKKQKKAKLIDRGVRLSF